MDIAAMYFELLSQKTATRKQKQKSSSNSQKQMTDGELAYWKREITRLRDETRGVCKLNWYSSYYHKAHVLSRNHYGDRPMPDELWDFWVCYVKQIQEQLIKEGYTPDDKLLRQKERNAQLDRSQQTKLLQTPLS